MTVTDQRDADDQIADALWWLRGFAAAIPADDRGIPELLCRNLLEIRRWLNKLSEGRTRLLGTHERAFALVLTEYEFEVLVDGITREASEDADVLAAQALKSKILTQLRAEQQAFTASRDKELPF